MYTGESTSGRPSGGFRQPSPIILAGREKQTRKRKTQAGERKTETAAARESGKRGESMSKNYGFQRESSEMDGREEAAGAGETTAAQRASRKTEIRHAEPPTANGDAYVHTDPVL